MHEGSDGPRGTSVSLRGITKTYGAERPAVDDVSLDVEAGEFLTLLGPSGSGKTTTLNAIAGFVELSSGSILFDGVDVASVATHKRGIGMVFQQFSLFPHMSVAENVAYPLRQRRMSRAEISGKVEAALGLVQLQDFRGRRPHELSGGQQQRVAVARAIVFQPRVLLMDEPFGALDRKLRESLQVELRGLHRTLGLTIIFVTHDQEEALVLSDRIAVFNNGVIEQVGSPRALYREPSTKFVATFLGESNIVEGLLLEEGGLNVLDSDYGRFPVAEARGGVGEKVSYLVRPDRVRVEPLDCVRGTESIGVPGVVRESIFLGDSNRIFVEVGSGKVLISRVPGTVDTRLRVGEPAYAFWEAKDMYPLAN